MTIIQSRMICAALGLLWGTMAITAHAAPLDVGRENQLKSAYLFNFLKFVEWQATSVSGTLTVCFSGADGVHDALSTGIDSKRVGSRRLALRRLQPGDPIAGCDVIYVDAATPANSPLFATRQPSVLTVSDLRGFARGDGIIEIFTESNRLRFKVNVDNAQAAGLRISASLLQLAAAIEKGGKK
jgi:hypothetical protein